MSDGGQRSGYRTSGPAPILMRVPGWEAHPWLRAGFSTRRAGVSSAYGAEELNLGWTRDDDPALVAQNRAVFVRAIAEGANLPLVTVGQVHGAVVRDLEREPSPLMTSDGRATLEGDGLISSSPGRLLAILTADCVPVLVADTRTHSVGAFHAGWRGTVARIVEQGVSLMQTQHGSRPEDLIAAIGPCIGACCFEVGAEVREAFTREFVYGEELLQRSNKAAGKVHIDLVQANRRQLLQAGLTEDRIQAMGECTSCTLGHDGGRKYYSYRAEAGRCGRMLSAIGAVS